MYDTARRVALVKQRVRENTRRRQRRGIYGLSAACMLLFAVLMQAAGTVVGPGQPPHGACSARCCCGRTRAAMCWWPSSPLPRRRRSPRCASGSESEKTGKKAGRTSRTDTNRRRKANEETNTQHPASMLHGADAAADNGLRGGCQTMAVRFLRSAAYTVRVSAAVRAASASRFMCIPAS